MTDRSLRLKDWYEHSRIIGWFRSPPEDEVRKVIEVQVRDATALRHVILARDALIRGVRGESRVIHLVESVPPLAENSLIVNGVRSVMNSLGPPRRD